MVDYLNTIVHSHNSSDYSGRLRKYKSLFIWLGEGTLLFGKTLMNFCLGHREVDRLIIHEKRRN